MPLRTRSKGALKNGLSTNVQLRYNMSSEATTAPGQTDGEFAMMTDFVTPGFSRKQNLGEIVNSPMEKITISSVTDLNVSSWVWDANPPYTFQHGVVLGFQLNDVMQVRSGVLTYPADRIPPWNETLAGLALASARSGAAKPEAQLLVSLGEARETLNLIDNALWVLTGRAAPFQALQRRYYRGELNYRDFLDAMSSAWLTGRYGIMPLVYDIQGYINAFTKAKKPVRLTSRGVERDSGSEQWSIPLSSDMISNLGIDWDLTWNVEYRATCLYEYADDMQARLGLRLADVPTAGLELVRLSFIADWFINLSDFVSSLTLAARSDVRMQCVSEYLTAQAIAIYHESGNVTNLHNTSRMVSDGSGSKVSFVYTRKTRKPYSESAVGTLSPRLNLSWKRIVDATALLATSMDISDKSKRRVRI